MSATSPAPRRGVVARVEGGEWAALEVRLRTEDGAVAAVGARRERFALDADDGARVSVEPGGSLDAPWVELARGPWRELAAHPLAEVLDAPRLGPQVRATLEHRGVRIGDAVRVVLDALEPVAEPDGTYREAPEVRSLRGRCTELALDPGGRAAPGERPVPTSAWAVAGAVGLVAVALAAPVAVFTGGGAYLPVLAASWIAFAIAGARALAPRFLGYLHVFPHAAVWRPAPGTFTVSRERLREENDRSRLGALVAVLFALTNGWLIVQAGLGAVGAATLDASGGDVLGVAVLAAVLAAAMIGFGWVTEGSARELASALLDRPTVPGWRLLEGVATSPWGGALVTARTTVEEVGRGASRGRRTVHAMSRSVDAVPELHVRDADGVEWTVTLEGAVAASTRPALVGEERARGWELVQRVMDGDRVRVGGYADEGTRRVAATGPGSLLLVFTPADASPAAALTRARRWSTSWIAIAAIDGLVLAVAAAAAATS